MQTFLAVIFIFGSAVIFHEFGHFIFAKLSDIKVHEFAVGMGPKLFGFKKGETTYSLRALPIGGYVKMEGEEESSSDSRAFNNKPLINRFWVIFGGPLMNFVLAVLVFSTSFYIMGFPTTVIDSLTDKYPAQVAGLQTGDKILRINDEKISTWNDVTNEIVKNKEKPLDIVILRGNNTLEYTIKPIMDSEHSRIMIGITPKFEKSFIQSVKYGFLETGIAIRELVGFLGQLLRGDTSQGTVVGPIGIIQIAGEAAKYGFINVMRFAGFISINLGIINLLPIPALDGSRLMFFLYEAIAGRPVKQEREAFIHFVGFVALLGLMVFISFKDILKLL